MAKQSELTKTGRQAKQEDRRREVAVLLAQGMNETEIGNKLGVDNTTICRDVKALKLISQQFIYDIAKSDFTFYYKQCLETVKLVLKRQFELADKEELSQQDMNKAKILADILQTVSTINEYYSQAKTLHKSPMQMALDVDYFGVRPGEQKREHKLTDEELEEVERQDIEDMKYDEEQEIRERIDQLARDKQMEEFERKLMREKGLLPPDSGNGSATALRKTRNPQAIF